jgi:hypothetical protein
MHESTHHHAGARTSSVGTMLSLACAVHCMAAPVLLLALPNLGSLLTSELEVLLVLGIVGLTIPAGRNAWRAGARWAIAGFAAGLVLLIASFVLGHDHAATPDHAAMLLGPALAIGGSLLLASAHWHTQRRLACC